MKDFGIKLGLAVLAVLVGNYVFSKIASKLP